MFEAAPDVAPSDDMDAGESSADMDLPDLVPEGHEVMIDYPPDYLYELSGGMEQLLPVRRVGGAVARSTAHPGGMVCTALL